MHEIVNIWFNRNQLIYQLTIFIIKFTHCLLTEMGQHMGHRVHPPASMYGGPEVMDDGMQMPPVGSMHPDMMADQIAGMPPGMNDPSQMLKHAVCNLINYQVL